MTTSFIHMFIKGFQVIAVILLDYFTHLMQMLLIMCMCVLTFYCLDVIMTLFRQ